MRQGGLDDKNKQIKDPHACDLFTNKYYTEKTVSRDCTFRFVNADRIEFYINFN